MPSALPAGACAWLPAAARLTDYNHWPLLPVWCCCPLRQHRGQMLDRKHQQNSLPRAASAPSSQKHADGTVTVLSCFSVPGYITPHDSKQELCNVLLLHLIHGASPEIELTLFCFVFSLDVSRESWSLVTITYNFSACNYFPSSCGYTQGFRMMSMSCPIPRTLSTAGPPEKGSCLLPAGRAFVEQ